MPLVFALSVEITDSKRCWPRPQVPGPEKIIASPLSLPACVMFQDM